MEVSVSAIKNAGLIVAVVKFGAKDFVSALPESIKHRREKHGDRRCGEVDPQSRPFAGVESRSERSGRIHTHAGKRGFKCYEGGDQSACKQRRVAAQPSRVRNP